MAGAPPKPAVVTGYPAMAAPPPPQYDQPYPPSNFPAGNPSASAYPYPAPPYYAGPQPYYDPASYNRHQRFIRRLVVGFIVLLVLVSAVTFLTWVVLRPRIPEFAVTSASASSFNISSSSQLLSSDFNVTLSVENPNKKMSVYYDRVKAIVFYGSEPLMETSLPPLFQEKRNSTFMTARFFVMAQYLDADVARGILEDRKNGAVEFQIGFFAGVRFNAGAWRTRKHWIRVYCDHVKINFGNGTVSAGLSGGSPRQCKVNL